MRCDFDPKTLECKGDDRASCLTPAQVQLVLKFYGPVVNPRTKEQIFPGYAMGNELGWGVPDWIGRMLPESLMGGGQYFKYALFQDPNWDYMTFDFDSQMARADRLDGGVTNAINPDPRGFFQHGGKLLQYHGCRQERDNCLMHRHVDVFEASRLYCGLYSSPPRLAKDCYILR